MGSEIDPELVRDPAVRTAARSVFECGQLEAMLRREFMGPGGSVHQSQEESEWRRTADTLSMARQHLADLLQIGSSEIQVDAEVVFVLDPTSDARRTVIYARRDDQQR